MSEARDGDEEMRIGEPETAAVGVPGVVVSMWYALSEMGPARSMRTLLRVNQAEGFDCPSCAWGDPAVKDRSHAEFCENGAKAVAWEATRKRVDAAFFAAHPVSFLREQTDHWLESNGRLTEPMYLADGAAHYTPIGWDDAFRLVAGRLRELPDPNRAVFYTSGRASNEAAFAYQLLARRLGTNNLPDCSNMCHESSGAALSQTIGIGKGQVTLEDISEHAELRGADPALPRPDRARRQRRRRGRAVRDRRGFDERGEGIPGAARARVRPAAERGRDHHRPGGGVVRRRSRLDRDGRRLPPYRIRCTSPSTR